jgi:iron complex outermembrane receptor protein
MKKRLLFLCLFLASNHLFGLDDLDIDDLLHDISSKTDLSEKTKLENGGISYVYTREDIRKMQAHNLKDILKSTYPFGYNENNFGLSDPFTVQSRTPFMSSSLKIYIDNQEITTGLYGSGMILYGNMDIDFVDHIEIYTGNPTFEFSTEPAFTIIKLYSKSVEKDEGSKVMLTGGSRGSKSASAYHAAILDNGWSYFVYGSLTEENREEYDNYNATLSRDTKTQHLLAKFDKEQQHLLIDLIRREQDAFTCNSIFATPEDTNIGVAYAHIGYDATFHNFDFLLSFDKYDVKTDFEDANRELIESINLATQQTLPYSAEVDSTSEVYTMGLNYHIHFHSDKLLFGVKYRLKHFSYDKMMFNDTPVAPSDTTDQMTQTAFIENYYSLADNKIFTSGFSCSRVTNNASMQDDTLFSYRLGFTYTNENFVSKTTISHIEETIDPYLVHSGFLAYPDEKVDKKKENIYIEDLKYQDNANQYELILSYMDIYNQLLPNATTGRLESYKDSFTMKSLVGRYIRTYHKYDKVELSLGYNLVENLPEVDRFKQYAATLRNFNSWGDIDIFNEFLYYRDDVEKRNYLDYSAGVIYHKTEDLSFALKGTNIFNRAKESTYNRLNLETLEPDSPLYISPIDQKIIVSMEYTF